jgi:hypothetical protein
MRCPLGLEDLSSACLVSLSPPDLRQHQEESLSSSSSLSSTFSSILSVFKHILPFHHFLHLILLTFHLLQIFLYCLFSFCFYPVLLLVLYHLFFLTPFSLSCYSYLYLSISSLLHPLIHFLFSRHISSTLSHLLHHFLHSSHFFLVCSSCDSYHDADSCQIV